MNYVLLKRQIDYFFTINIASLKISGNIIINVSSLSLKSMTLARPGGRGGRGGQGGRHGGYRGSLPTAEERLVRIKITHKILDNPLL